MKKCDGNHALSAPCSDPQCWHGPKVLVGQPADTPILTIHAPEYDEIATIAPDGTVTVHKEGAEPEAARIFWDAIQFEGQSLMQRIEELTAALAAEKEE